ncbi:MAG: aldehyde dehydrogenase (NAD+) [Paraglaciecola sp.]
MLQYQVKIESTFGEDFHKSTEERYLTEISIILNKIEHHMKKLKKWSARNIAAGYLF